MKTLLQLILWICLIVGLGIGINLMSSLAMVIFVLPFGLLLKATYRGMPLRPVVGAVVGALVVLIPFWGWCLYDMYVRLPSAGGGANIGLGLALFVLPIVLAATMSLGWLLAGGNNVRVDAIDNPNQDD